MMFNSRKEISFKEIKDAMKFDDDTCAKNLKSMSQKNYKILNINIPPQRTFLTDDDILMINENFTSNSNPAIPTCASVRLTAWKCLKFQKLATPTTGGSRPSRYCW